MVVLNCYLSAQIGHGHAWEEIARYTVMHEQHEVAASMALVHGSAKLFQLLKGGQLPVHFTLSVLRVNEDDMSSLENLNLEQVVKIIPEHGHGRDKPHPRHHGYQDGF